MEFIGKSSINGSWAKVYNDLCSAFGTKGYYELIGYTYSFNPETENMISNELSLINLKKLAAMYVWYKCGDRNDKMILKYFDEYKRCIDKFHPTFNSNYGYYAFTKGGLDRCVQCIINDKNTRHACFCINNNYAMGHNSIDKLCTNTIQFFVRNNKLEMIVQMRSSNAITFLPYDAFMFSVFFWIVFHRLCDTNKAFYGLKAGKITMQVASLHMYVADVEKTHKIWVPKVLLNPYDKNWQLDLEEQLIKAFIK